MNFGVVTKTLNIKTDNFDKSDPTNIYIGRYMGKIGMVASPLKNPYKVSKIMTRDAAIAKYRKYLWQCIQERNAVYIELQRLITVWDKHHKLSLFCWCKPLPCHGDVILSALQYLYRCDRGG